MTDRTFAQRLKAILDSRPEITESGLATKAGLSDSVVRKILKGTTKNPRVDTAIKVCAALGTTLEDFMSGAFEAGPIPADTEAQRIRSLLSQLSPRERRLLLTYGEGLRDAQNAGIEEPPEGEE
ncbi:helix-turn-helix domain-containing protein [Antarcticimicrobium sediminis]|uniref:XRE family transcriptional regulator n=1 Tax=Antarcticimicrobium sediminis TaxID=2546227 RepID=A0A4R5EI38_9RHOB|nr:helix-turn-helix transcriptional regulator [Antarcticimicrobium sediminis]TDE34149.1 XRE family transcriptional regulator [Antarcticimicrobium sediminis]